MAALGGWSRPGSAGPNRCATPCRSTRPCRPCGAEQRGRGTGAVPRVHHGQGQGGRARPVARRRPRPGRRGARGDGARGEGARRRQRRVVGRRRAAGAGRASPPTTSSTPSSRARRSRSCATCGWHWRATTSTCASPLTSPSARPRTRCACATSRPPTSSSSRWRRSVGCGPRSRSSRPVGCPRWCRRPSTRASASRPGSRSRLPCRRSSTPAGWARSRCSTATSRPRRSCRWPARCRSAAWSCDPGTARAARRTTRARRVVARTRAAPTPSSCRGAGPVIDIRWTWLFLDTPRADAGRSWALLVRGHRVAAVAPPAVTTTSSPRCCRRVATRGSRCRRSPTGRAASTSTSTSTTCTPPPPRPNAWAPPGSAASATSSSSCARPAA